MGKKQHQKDKIYLTCTEWTTYYGGRKKRNDVGDKTIFQGIPFDLCALSLQPFENPFCTRSGIVYDLSHIVPFLAKYKVDPASGEPFDSQSLIKLNFSKNTDGKYHCPVLFKVFNQHSHIVAIKTTGNVFSYEAVEQLNLKPKNFKDLLTDDSFTSQDIIVIQDPLDVEKRNLNCFYHVRNRLPVGRIDDISNTDHQNLRNIGNTAKDILKELEERYKVIPKVRVETNTKQDKFNSAHYSTGILSSSCTSTATEVFTTQQAAILDEDTVRYRMVKTKGYARIHTNMGPLNIELHCDMTPRTCENFIKLSKSGFYNNTLFHRSIRHFMIQGGDSTGTGNGGQSAWGVPFDDEFKPNISHRGRGVLSMVNTGPNTNKSQFFITFRSCPHLDNKNTIFGRVVGGLETLNLMERVEVDDQDRPITDIKVLKVSVFVDPYEEADKNLKKMRGKGADISELSPVKKKFKVHKKSVGRYIYPHTPK